MSDWAHAMDIPGSTLIWARGLLRHRILEGDRLQLWIGRIIGDLPWDPEDPSGRRAAAEDAAMTDGGTVIYLRDHRVDAPM